MLLMTLSYAGSLSGDFVYEDVISVRDCEGWQADLRDAVTAPIRGLSRLSWCLAPTSPLAQHVVNVAWHGLNGLLLWMVAQTVLAESAAVLAVALFLLSPLQVESVAYVAGRPELISGMWGLLALLATSRGWIAGAWLCAALAITGKEMGLAVWLLVPLWAWWTGQQWTRMQRGAWWLSALAVSTAAIWTLEAQHFAPSWMGSAVRLAELGRLLLLWPESMLHPEALTIQPYWGWVSRPVALAGVALWCLAMALCVRRWRWGALALAWTGTALWLRLLFPLWDDLHERYLYTPLIAWSLAIGSVFSREG